LEAPSQRCHTDRKSAAGCAALARLAGGASDVAGPQKKFAVAKIASQGRSRRCAEGGTHWDN